MEPKKFTAFIERIENKLAILTTEHLGSFTIPQAFLPDGAREGNALELFFTLDPAAEQELRERIKRLQEEMQEEGNQHAAG
jgi:hypothetical protein